MTETLSHTALSTARAITKDRPDVALVLNAGNSPLLRPLKAAGIPVAIHLDGLESKREKWRGAGARYYRWAEKVAVRNGDEVIADAQSIADYVAKEYGREATVVAYGANVIDPGSARLSEVNVIRRDYHLVVARLEPENHVLEAVHGYSISEETRPLLVVGSAPYSRWYIDRVNEIATLSSGVRMLGGVYDQELLDQLYANARTYIHGHSVGGTNPSLLRAMGAGAPVLAFDCEFNREVTADEAFIWKDAESLATILDEVAEGEVDDELAAFSRLGQERIASSYQWDVVTDHYEELVQRLARKRSSQTRASRGV
jgi:glycosyltransferase involved in cell wall biosynthesis